MGKMDYTLKALLEEERIARTLLARHAYTFPLAEQLFARLVAAENAIAEYRRLPRARNPPRRRTRSRSA